MTKPDDTGPELPLAAWADYLLCGPHDAMVYQVSRTEPFRLLRTRQAHDTPVTPPLIGRTVKTVVSILEPEQPGDERRSLVQRISHQQRDIR